MNNYNLEYSGDGSVKINVKTNDETIDKMFLIAIPIGHEKVE